LLKKPLRIALCNKAHRNYKTREEAKADITKYIDRAIL